MQEKLYPDWHKEHAVVYDSHLLSLCNYWFTVSVYESVFHDICGMCFDRIREEKRERYTRWIKSFYNLKRYRICTFYEIKVLLVLGKVILLFPNFTANKNTISP